MKICFYQQGIACNGNTPLTKPLGGTESAMIYMARALAERGHEVHVFCTNDIPGTYEGVSYHPWEEFEPFGLREGIDVFICIRSLLPLLAGRWAKLQIYFSPDAFDQPFLKRAYSLKFQHEGIDVELGLYSLAFTQTYADAFFCVGNWQAETFIKHFRLPPHKVHVVHNGVALQDFYSLPVSSRQKDIVYCSTPFRGLEYLLRYFPEIRRRVPQATCTVISGMQLYGLSDEEDKKAFKSIYDLADQPGVRLVGPLAKRKMADYLAQSRVLAYPNTFAETFCIAALECQASGLPIVSTNLAAMKERVDTDVDGYLIEGHPSQEDYREAFIEKTIQLLSDDNLWKTMSEKARNKGASFTYASLAKQWEGLFQRLLVAETPLCDPFVPQELFLNLSVDEGTKRVHLPQKLLVKYFANMLRSGGFAHTASQLDEKCVLSTLNN